MVMGDWRAAPALVLALGDTGSMDDDVPYAVLGLSTNESLGTEASAQEVDTPESLPALDWVLAHARLERPEDLRLPRLVHGLILFTLDCRAKVDVDCLQDILDCDERVARGMSGIWRDCEQPGEVTNAKGKGGQGRGRGGRSEDGRGEAWVGM
jgi:hypothetical protein